MRSATLPLILSAAIVGVWSVGAHGEAEFFKTLAFVGAVIVFGLAAIYATARRLNDPNLLKVRYVFIAKIALVLFACFLWDRTLRSPAAIDGDQERYYYEAASLAANGLKPSAVPIIVPNINYAGILYVYGAVIAAFGENAFSPAVFNTAATLVTTLLLIHLCYRIKRKRDPSDWILGLAMLVPEVVCWDVMISRDTLVMSLLSIPILLIGNALIAEDGKVWRALLLAVPFFIVLAGVRTTALIPAAASVIVLLVAFRSRMRTAFIVAISAAALAFLFIAPRFSTYLGGYNMTYAAILSVTVISPEHRFIDAFTWSPRSIGRLLIPHSLPQAILLAVPRFIAYLIVPLPAAHIDWHGVVAGNWLMWQELLPAVSSVLYVALFPLALLTIKNAVLKRDSTIAVAAPFLITMVTVASGTAILHERYRVMAVPFLCGCLWLGRLAPRRQLWSAYIIWGSVLVAGACAAVVYKYVLA